MSRIKLTTVTLTVLAPGDWDDARLEAASNVVEAFAVTAMTEAVAASILRQAACYEVTQGIEVEVS